MLGVNQSDFMSYMSALKTNYRKGIHRMEAILANPTHASEFAANLGGVSVVLGVPVGLPDRNSDKLLELLLGSDVADDAVLTWMHQFYEFTDWDDLMGNAERCKEMALFFAQRVILGKTQFDEVPKALKTKVAEILLDSGLPELVPPEFGGTADAEAK